MRAWYEPNPHFGLHNCLASSVKFYSINVIGNHNGHFQVRAIGDSNVIYLYILQVAFHCLWGGQIFSRDHGMCGIEQRKSFLILFLTRPVERWRKQHRPRLQRTCSSGREDTRVPIVIYLLFKWLLQHRWRAVELRAYYSFAVEHATATVVTGIGHSSGHVVGHGGMTVAVANFWQAVLGASLQPAGWQYFVEV